MSRFGLVAGNGQFPILTLQSARALGHDVVVIAIKEEAEPAIDRLASKAYWISLGQLGRLIEICKAEGLEELIFAGQVKHTQIFSSIRPDWRLLRLLTSLATKNTDSLIGAVIEELNREGIRVVDSTRFLKPLLASEGVMTRRKPTSDEKKDLEYGRQIAHVIASLDVGQSIAICERAVVAVEAMEGTDEMLRRAARLVNGRPLRLVKVSTRRKHLLFDVPVIGPRTIEVMKETGTTAAAVDAGRTLMLEKDLLIEKANEYGLALVGYSPIEGS